MKLRPQSLLGFSLVELSIVLVILGLLVGGVLAGQSLIKASQLRRVTEELNGYVMAYNTFRDRYMAIPGDMSNASQFWNTTGNGDGNFSICENCSERENEKVWLHLTLAGLIEGVTLNPTGSGGNWAMSPMSKYPKGVWGLSQTCQLPNNCTVAANSGIMFSLGGVHSSWASPPNYYNIDPRSGFMRPDDAYTIDMKIDDGHASRGKMLAVSGRLYGDPWGASDCSGYDYNSNVNYNLASTSAACYLQFNFDRK